jgi:hypothetical protein
MVALALVMIIARLVVRFKTRRRLFIDDYFILIAVPCAIASGALVHVMGDGLYLYRSITVPNPVVSLNFEEIGILLPVSTYTLSFVETSWTAIFCVKFSFLALFHGLIKNISRRLVTYFWCVVGFTILSWAFLLTESPILCAYYGEDSLKCLNDNGVKYTSLTTLVALLDIITDIMVVSFPILILRKSMMDKRQKMWIRIFLSLSVIMILIAIIRVLGAIRKGEKELDVTWNIFWQQMEACAAIMAASATVIRTVFIKRESNQYTPPAPEHRKVSPKGFSLLEPTASELESGYTQTTYNSDHLSSAPRIPLSVVDKGSITTSQLSKSWNWSFSNSSIATSR